ncbi:hypothetical protein [Pseudomonas sp. EL_65y_Pfl2_R96]|uniref:hypothetical protein n=1 Tax=Pseudomonas sp. EL_65y_Pfl2_R96 TaxID=3088699 RepID=UPI0030DDAB21
MTERKQLYVRNIFTGKPFETAPDGTDMKGLVFETEEELREFVNAHWPEPPVEMV